MPSIPRRSDRRGQGTTEEVCFFCGEDTGTDVRLTKVRWLRFALEHRASVFDIVTVEGEGCSDAGWEEMSSGGRHGTEKQMAFREGFYWVSSPLRPGLNSGRSARRIY